MNLKNVPQTAGVYLFKDKKGRVIYIGKAVNLKNRLKSYLQKNLLSAKTKELIKNLAAFSLIKTESEFEALLLEIKLIREYKPKYNSLSKDDKHPLYIKITREEFPKISTCRREDEKNSFYFGPFPNSRAVIETVKFLRRIFPYCTEKKIKKKACFYSHLGLCAPCPNEIHQTKGVLYQSLKKEYRSNIFRLKRVLEGKYKEVLKTLTAAMKLSAKKLDYEKALQLKSQIEKLAYLTTNHQRISSYLENPNFADDLRQKELSELSALLKIPLPGRIEGYDISNLSGKEAAGSMTVFIDGEVEKSLYRRFKIRFKKRVDDLAMIKELIIRRLDNNKWQYPSLMVIDGAEGQINTVYKVLKERNLKIPIVGLAKRLEEIIIPKLKNERLIFEHVLLPKSSPSLKLLQRVRDEAHRFARKYHLFLRKKSMLY